MIRWIEVTALLAHRATVGNGYSLAKTAANRGLPVKVCFVPGVSSIALDDANRVHVRYCRDVSECLGAAVSLRPRAVHATAARDRRPCRQFYPPPSAPRQLAL